MDGFIQVPLKNMLKQYGEDKVKTILSDFYCPLNYDVEYFLHNKAIEFARQGIAPTHLVFTNFREVPRLVGYYTLTTKSFFVSSKNLSSNMRKRISKFGRYNNMRVGYEIPAPLIAQLGKNYKDNLNILITGDELLKIAIDKISVIQSQIGGKIIYLECEDNLKLKEFYISNGFVIFGKRNLDRDEKEKINAEYLIQMLKYL